MNGDFLPEKIETPELSDYDEWSPEGVIEQIGKKYKRIEKLKPAIEDVIMLFWTAHEKIVNKHESWKDWTWGEFCKSTGWSEQTVINWFNKYGLPYTQSFSAVGNRSPKNLGEDKPLKKQTNPETKFKLDQAVETIKNEEVSDDHLKQVGDALADRIKGGDVAPRVGSRVSTATQKAHKNKGGTPKEQKEIDNFERIRKSVRHTIDGLTAWADGKMEPETDDEKEAAKAILASGANLILQYARLGLDIEGIHKTFIEGEKNEYSEEEKLHRAREISRRSNEG